MFTQRNKRSGFTLVELMLVVVIIGILAGAILPQLAGRSKQAKVTRAKSDVKSIELALGVFELDTGDFPTTDMGIKGLITEPSDLPDWQGPYLRKKKFKDPWGNSYQYVLEGTHNPDFDLYSMGPDGVDGNEDDIGNWDDDDDE